MGYEAQMQAEIIGLLQIFSEHVPDHQTHTWVIELVRDRNHWKNGHTLFNTIRQRHLKATAKRDRVRECQYCFEEVCLQSLYNETFSGEPFDMCSPYWIIKNALIFSHAIGVSEKEVIDVVAPRA